MLLLLACVQDASPDPDTTKEAFAIPPIEWETCDLYSDGGGPDAGCATVQTPLRADDPEGEMIDVFVKRYHPEGGASSQALWLLQGGPGASGLVFETLSESFATKFPDVDYYFPDHRGTGRSTRLGCVAEDEETDGGRTIMDGEWTVCQEDAVAEYGDSLAAFNTTNAANDVGLLVDAVATETGLPQFVFGVSYGTYWAHRYLQLYPDQADGVILDSMAPPGASLYRQDEDADIAAELFFDACGADSFCASKLGEGPWAVADELVEKLKAGHCPEIAIPDWDTHVLFRRAFGSLLMDPTFRTYIPAVVYRANRCSEDDIEALSILMAMLTQPAPESLEFEYWGYVLTHNIIVSEFGEDPMPTQAELEAIREGAVASRDITTMLEQTLTWPAYPDDAYEGVFAETDTPLLMLQGGLDPATLLEKARPFQDQFTGPHQTWVEFPTGTHTTISSTAFVDEIGETRSCATRLVMAFVVDPESELDTGCVEEVIPLDFTLPETSYNQALFGRRSAWE